MAFEIPQVLSPIATSLFVLHTRTVIKRETMTASLVMANEALEQYRRQVMPNNWLKMHGYPMRRKRRH